MDGKEIKIILGKNIKFFRFRRQLSQAELAENADISIAFLSNIERGIKYPQADTLSRIACSLGVEVFELFKPEAIPDGSRDAIDELSEDIRTNINQTIDAVFRMYRR